MKPAAALFLNLLLVAGGILAYDALRGEGAGSAYEGPPAWRPETAGDGGEEARLGGDAASFGLRQRLAALEAAVRRLEAAAPPSGEPAARGAAEGERAVPVVPAVPPPAFDPLLLAEARGRGLDEETLTTLSVYYEEIERRRANETKRRRIREEVARMGLELDVVRSERLVDEALAFQARMQEILERSYTRDEQGPRDRMADIQALKAAHEEEVRALLPPADAERYLQSGYGRGLNFVGGGR